MDMTITAKIKIVPTEDQKDLLLKTMRAIKEGLNDVSEVVFETKILGQAKLWTKIRFKKPEYDLVWNRDDSLTKGVFSVNTLDGRIKVPFETGGMEHFFDGTWRFGTAKLVLKKGKYFLHIPMTKTFEDADLNQIRNVVGVDLGSTLLQPLMTPRESPLSSEVGG
jgi:putative transposase